MKRVSRYTQIGKDEGQFKCRSFCVIYAWGPKREHQWSDTAVSRSVGHVVPHEVETCERDLTHPQSKHEEITPQSSLPCAQVGFEKFLSEIYNNNNFYFLFTKAIKIDSYLKYVYGKDDMKWYILEMWKTF